MKHSASFTGISSKHWVPPELRFRVLPEGGLVCLKPDESQEGSLAVRSVLIVSKQIMFFFSKITIFRFSIH